MKKKQLFGLSFLIIASAVILALVLNLLFKIHSESIFSAEWEAGDALNYVASIFGALGTIILGYVAYKQNDRLQEMEKNNYIANYSSMILMESIYIKSKAEVPLNWDIHFEQIIEDSDCNDNIPYVGYKFTFKAKSIGNSIPVLIHIKKCNIICNDKSKKSNVCLFGNQYSDSYSRIAINQNEEIKFGMTYVINAQKREVFENVLRQSTYNVILEIVFDIITDKGVVTQCKCISDCFGKNSAGQIIWQDTDPKVFFYGHAMEKLNDLKIAGEKNRDKLI